MATVTARDPREHGPAEAAEVERPPETSDRGGLTILIPNWNHRIYLPRSLRSALDALYRLEAQGFSGEIIVVDDASRDGSQRFLRSVEQQFGDRRLQTVFLQGNRGLPFVRNLGLRLARHRHLLLLHADNELIPDNLPLFLRAANDTGAALVYGNLIDRQVGRPVGIRSNEAASMRLTKQNFIDAFAIVDVEAVLELGGYTDAPQLYGWEDWDLVLHLIAEEQQVVFVPAVLGYYHVGPLSMIEETNRTAKKRYKTVKRIYAQSGTREWDDVRVGRIYHPDVGYLDERW